MIPSAWEETTAAGKGVQLLAPAASLPSGIQVMLKGRETKCVGRGLHTDFIVFKQRESQE